MPKNDDLELMYGLQMMEGRQYLDLMYLPSDAIAWLFDQPEDQVQAAMAVGKEAHLADNPVVNATLLKDDELIIICELQSGRKIRIYPGGGLSSDGKPYDLGDLVELMGNDIPDVELGMDRAVDPTAIDPMEPVGQPPMGAAPPPPEPAGGAVSVVAPPPDMAPEPPIEPSPDEGLDMEDDLLGGMGVKPLSDLM